MNILAHPNGWLIVSGVVFFATGIVVGLVVVFIVPGLWREGLASLRELLAKKPGDVVPFVPRRSR